MNEKGIEADSSYSHPLLSGLPAARAKKGKVVSAEEAVRVIRDGDTIATGGFVGIGFAEELAIELENYFLRHQKPRNLTLLYADLSISARTPKKSVSWGLSPPPD